MDQSISCRDLAALMTSDKLYAVFDVRERGEFNACQIAGATSLPRSQIEIRVAQLVPNSRISIVVYDDDGARATLAGRRLEELCYSDVKVLEGGLPAWKREGHRTVSGVNVPSKAFGEKVHRDRRIPEITVEELKGLGERASDIMILDMRTPEEYGRFCIPGGVNVPGGDLVLWAEELRRNPERLVVVNCAGRTRSIIGTAGLRRLGVENVRALKNGTMGWVLAGLELESKPAAAARLAPRDSREKALTLARRIAEEEKIRQLSVGDFETAATPTADGLIYVIDVRSEQEFDNGHLPGSFNVPGGQAVQRADDFIAVRNGTIIFVSEHGARATMAAYWYRQMGFRDVSVLAGGMRAWVESGRRPAYGAELAVPLGLGRARSGARSKPPAEIQKAIQDAAVIALDVGSSLDYSAAHLPGAKWLSRGWIDLWLPAHAPNRDQAIVLSCATGNQSILAAQTLAELGYRNVTVLDGGVRGWVAQGYPAETGLTNCLVAPNDIVLSPSITGDREEMKRYLEWEVKLEQSQAAEKRT